MTPGDGRVGRDVADAWRRILLRRPSWRSDAELRVTYERGAFPEAEVAALGPETSGPGASARTAVDLATVDARPSVGDVLAIEARDGRAVPLAEALARIPDYALIARRYRQTG
jgi:hypothetical protein